MKYKKYKNYMHKAFTYSKHVKTMICNHNCTSQKRNYLSSPKVSNLTILILKVVMLYRIKLSVTLHFIIKFNMMRIFIFLINNSTTIYKNSLITHTTSARPIFSQPSSILYLARQNNLFYTKYTSHPKPSFLLVHYTYKDLLQLVDFVLFTLFYTWFLQLIL